MLGDRVQMWGPGVPNQGAQAPRCPLPTQETRNLGAPLSRDPVSRCSPPTLQPRHPSIWIPPETPTPEPRHLGALCVKGPKCVHLQGIQGHGDPPGPSNPPKDSGIWVHPTPKGPMCPAHGCRRWPRGARGPAPAPDSATAPSSGPWAPGPTAPSMLPQEAAVASVCVGKGYWGRQGASRVRRGIIGAAGGVF